MFCELDQNGRLLSEQSKGTLFCFIISDRNRSLPPSSSPFSFEQLSNVFLWTFLLSKSHVYSPFSHISSVLSSVQSKIVCDERKSIKVSIGILSEGKMIYISFLSFVLLHYSYAIQQPTCAVIDDPNYGQFNLYLFP